MLPFFAATLVLSATLLFVVQPMVARMLLPLLGGSAAVWTACMLFFQVALLAGYGYAHGLAGRLPIKRWTALHLVLMAIAGLTLPFSFAQTTPDANAPLSWLLTTLLLRVAPAFVLISASAPMIQHWFASTNHIAARNPYQLYAASNVGSMVALLGYPVVIEPLLGLHDQNLVFCAGYGMLGVLIAGCGFLTTRNADLGFQKTLQSTARPLWTERGRWLVLAAIPSSLMLGVTQFITTDLASVPMLWVIPLAIYLATFIAVFADKALYFPAKMTPIVAILVVLALALSSSNASFFVAAGAHLLVFALLIWVLHGQLAASKPAPANLTEYFLILSVGGALGGLFNAFIAPTFMSYAIDYHLALIVALPLIIWPVVTDPFQKDPWKFVAPGLIFCAGVWMTYEVGFLAPKNGSSVALVGGLLLLSAGAIYVRPSVMRFIAAGLVCIAAFESADTRGLVSADRSFFGAYKVFDRDSRSGTLRKFSHGTTAHGAQFLGEKEGLPTAYHHPSGPVGQVLGAIPHTTVAVVGLGAGAMAAYAAPGHRFDFFEIDPLVEKIARENFTYLSRCGDACTVTVGDGRRELAANSAVYDIIFLDAYNSDSVPMHLLTREAHALYKSKLRGDGIVVYHVSNRYLDIGSAVGAIAKDAGDVCWVQLHRPSKELERSEKVMPSMYAVVATKPEILEPLRATGNWRPCPNSASLWTDDFGSILGLLK